MPSKGLYCASSKVRAQCVFVMLILRSVASMIRISVAAHRQRTTIYRLWGGVAAWEQSGAISENESSTGPITPTGICDSWGQFVWPRATGSKWEQMEAIAGIDWKQLVMTRWRPFGAIWGHLGWVGALRAEQWDHLRQFGDWEQLLEMTLWK